MSRADRKLLKDFAADLRQFCKELGITSKSMRKRRKELGICSNLGRYNWSHSE